MIWTIGKKVKSAYKPSGPAIRPVLNFGFCGMEQPGVFLLPFAGMLVHRRITPSSTHLYTWVASGTVGVSCLAQEHNTMSLARTQTWTA